MASGINVTMRWSVWGFSIGLCSGSMLSAIVFFSRPSSLRELILIPLCLAIFLFLCGGFIGGIITLLSWIGAGTLNFFHWAFKGESELKKQTVLVNDGIVEKDIVTPEKQTVLVNDGIVEGDITRTNRGSAIPRGRMRIAYCTSDLPDKPGIYRHINKATNTVDYIGQTNNIKRRNQEHISSGNLDLSTQKVAYAIAKPDSNRDDWCNTEKAHIKEHEPSGNTYAGGNGRR